MRFGEGWVAFSKDNNLEKGDVTANEVIDVTANEVIERTPVVISVSIFHLVDHQSLDKDNLFKI